MWVHHGSYDGRDADSPGCSGQNPGMYLKDKPDGPFVHARELLLCLWVSRYGRGQALVLLGLKLIDTSSPAGGAQCLRHRQRRLSVFGSSRSLVALARFRGATALDSMRYVPLTGSQARQSDRARATWSG